MKEKVVFGDPQMRGFGVFERRANRVDRKLNGGQERNEFLHVDSDGDDGIVSNVVVAALIIIIPKCFRPQIRSTQIVERRRDGNEFVLDVEFETSEFVVEFLRDENHVLTHVLHFVHDVFQGSDGRKPE